MSGIDKGTPTAVADVERVRDYAHGARVAYKVKLACTCTFTEDRDRSELAPQVGERALCFGNHDSNKSRQNSATRR